MSEDITLRDFRSWRDERHIALRLLSRFKGRHGLK